MSFENVPLGKKAPDIINTIIEIPRGSKNKYEYDEELDLIKLDRALHSPVHYPTDYGFVPGTRSEDGDHLDVLLLITDSVFPGCLVEARPIGILDMDDEAGKDWKIIAVANKDPRYKDVTSVKDLNDHFIKEVEHFFEVYKQLEGKWAKVGAWQEAAVAKKMILESQARFESEKHS